MSKITKTNLSAPEAFSHDYMHCGVHSAPKKKLIFSIVCSDSAHVNVRDRVPPDV